MDFKCNLNEMLFLNIKKISDIIPAPRSVNEVLKEDMFAVPNKKAFSELIYYLLSITHPEKCKEHLVWPCLCKKDEMKFRLGINKIVSEISENCEGRIVQPLNSSLMIAPGGSQVVEFMWRMSVYTMKLIATKYLGLTVPLHIEPAKCNPMILKARLKVVYQVPTACNNDAIKSGLLRHKDYVIQAMEEKRNLRNRLVKSENERLKVESQLQSLIEECEIEQCLKDKLKQPDTINDGLEELNKNIQNKISALNSSVQSLSNFESEIRVTYENLKFVTDSRRRITLDGSTLKVTVPSVLKNCEMILYKEGNLVLENLFKVGLEVVSVLQRKISCVDVSELLQRLPPISVLRCDMSLNNTNFNRILFDLYQMRSDAQRSISAFNYLTESGLDSSITRLVDNAQSPPVILNDYNRRLSEIGMQKKKSSGGKLLRWISKRKFEKSNKNTSENIKSIQKLPSRLKQPQKITSYGSTSKSMKSLRFSEAESVNNKILSNKSSSSKKMTNIENVTPKKNVAVKSAAARTSKQDHEEPSPRKIVRTKSVTTPRNRFTTYELHDKNSKNLCKSEESLASTSNSSVEPHFASTVYSISSVEVDDIFLKELSGTEVLNLSQEALPSDLDSTSESIPGTPPPVVNFNTQTGMKTGFSPSGAVNEGQLERRKPRASLEAIINRYRRIKMRQLNDPINESIFKNDFSDI